MYTAIARNVIEYFRYENGKLYLLVDTAYSEIAKIMANLRSDTDDTELRLIQSDTAEQIQNLFDFPTFSRVLLLAEPKTYVKYKLFQHLTFSEGEPQIPGTSSRVLIFPKESIYRIFSGDMSKSLEEKEQLLASMKEYQKYRVITSLGTDLVFESRHWIPLDFEVCTAPVESSINGTIVVDGALFFKKIEDTLTFVIKDGKLQDIIASSKQGKALVAEYKTMTAGIMKHPANLQLAEIGIGFMSGAAISDCFMEAETVSNTCHFCFGNNVCYGGENESDFHGASLLIKEPVFSSQK